MPYADGGKKDNIMEGRAKPALSNQLSLLSATENPIQPQHQRTASASCDRESTSAADSSGITLRSS